MNVDETDRRILRVLQTHPKLPINEVAVMAGLSHTPCWRRMKRLEKEGVILGRALLIDPVSLGLHATVFAQLKVGKHDEATLEQLEAAVLSHPEIVECFSMTGDSDYLIRVLIGNIEQYERFLKKVLLHLPGVSAVNSSFALKTLKLTNEIPI